MEGNPAARVKTVAPETSRERVLSADELKKIWEVLDQVGESVLTTQMAALLKIRLLTAQRHGEVSQMRWQDIRRTSLGSSSNNFLPIRGSASNSLGGALFREFESSRLLKNS